MGRRSYPVPDAEAKLSLRSGFTLHFELVSGQRLWMLDDRALSEAQVCAFARLLHIALLKLALEEVPA